MADTRTDIANQALLLIGERLIDSIDSDTTEPARTMRALLPTAIREVLAMHSWQEVTTRRTMTPTAAEPDEYGYFKFYLPANFIRLAGFPYLEDPDYRIEGTELYVFQDDAPVVAYVRYSENPSEWGPLLAQAIYTHLGAKAAFTISQNPQLAQTLKDELEQRVLPKARFSQASTCQRPQTIRRAGNWLKSRRGGY